MGPVLFRRYSAYGFTKAGMAQLTKSVSDETKGSGVRVHTISPGMVHTDLITAGLEAFGAQVLGPPLPPGPLPPNGRLST